MPRRCVAATVFGRPRQPAGRRARPGSIRCPRGNAPGSRPDARSTPRPDRRGTDCGPRPAACSAPGRSRSIPEWPAHGSPPAVSRWHRWHGRTASADRRPPAPGRDCRRSNRPDGNRRRGSCHPAPPSHRRAPEPSPTPPAGPPAAGTPAPRACAGRRDAWAAAGTTRPGRQWPRPPPSRAVDRGPGLPACTPAARTSSRWSAGRRR